MLCLFIAANVFSQERESKRVFRPAGQVMGMNVQNSKGESLGHIQDLVINMKDGSIVYAAMSRGQVLGFGGSLFAIDPKALSLSADGNNLILNATNQQFENAKGFDQNAWPTRPTFGATAATASEPVREDNRPNASVKTNENLARISALQGLTVYGRDDKSVGRIYDLAMSCNDHKVAYAAVHHGGALGIGGKLVAVPWQALTMKAPALNPQQRAFYINASQQDFENAQGFTTDNWPTEADARFRDLRRAE
jgi:sporulation protein YlmC with PRC-barrel domain